MQTQSIQDHSLWATVKYDQGRRTIVKNIYLIPLCISKGLDIEGISLGACGFLSMQVIDFNLRRVYAIILGSEELKNVGIFLVSGVEFGNDAKKKKIVRKI